MSNIKIKNLIIAALGLLLGLMVMLAGVGLYGIAHTERQFKEVTLHDARTQQVMLHVKLLMESNRSQILQALQHNPEFEWSKLHDHPLDIHFKTITDNVAKLGDSWKTYVNGITASEERTLAEAWFEKSGQLGRTSIEAASSAIEKGDWNSAESVLIKTINPTYRAGLAAADELTAHLKQRGTVNDEQVASRIATLRWSVIGTLLTAIALAVAAGVVLMRNITAPLREAVGIARRVAGGDLSTPIRVNGTNEVGTLLTALNDMNLSLSTVVGAVRRSADCIASGAGEIAGGNADLSRRTGEQASSVQQTASSMEELSTTVASNADSARQAAALAGAASQVAVHGGTVFGQVATTMNDIAASSRKISDIIAVIDGIAFQTNILALNAAVEAARAGEQGRGFAVVASEVRGLAQRSATAAKEIAALIRASVERVESGTAHVDNAGSTMTDVVEQVKRVSALIGEISSATSEQNSGIGEVGRAVQQLDRTTQQNATLVEQSAAAAQNLQQEAKQLVAAVAGFTLKAG